MLGRSSFDGKHAFQVILLLLSLSLPATAISQVEFEETGTQITITGAFGDTRAIRFADLDADGDLDVIPGSWLNSFRIWLNDGQGSYVDSEFDGGSDANRVNWLLVEHFDDDAFLDVIAVRGGNEPSTLWFGDGSGGLTLSGQSFPTGSHAAADDLDGDDDTDVVFGGGQVYSNDGTGQFSELVELGASGPVAIGDLNGDDDADILFAAGTTGNVYFNDGTTPPGFGSPSSQPVLGGRTLELVDLDGDDDLDAVTNIGAYLNDGSGSFTEQQLWNGDVMEAITADVDQDGDLDVALALRGPSFSEAPNEVWVNDGNAVFTDSGLRLGNDVTAAAAFGDFDSDSDPDLIFGATSSDFVYLHENLTDAWRVFRDRFEDGGQSSSQ